MAIYIAQDTLKRPANTTAYAANQAVNCNLTVTAGSYVGATKTVTLTSASHPLVAGDRITVVGVNTGFTWANVDGSWVVTEKDTNTFSFVTTVTPTGSTPGSATISNCVSKLLRFASMGHDLGGAVKIVKARMNFPGASAAPMVVRLWLYNLQVGTLVDQANFTLLTANDSCRQGYIDFALVGGHSTSDTSFAEWTPGMNGIGQVRVFTASADAALYGRLQAISAGTPANAGVVTVRLWTEKV